MNSIIRPATSADLAQLDSLFLEGDRWHATHEPTVFRVPIGPPRGDAFLQQWLQGPESTILVAEREGELLGVVMLTISPARELPMLRPRRIGVVDTLIVAERARRQGLGRRLMLAAEDWFRARHCTDLQISVWDFNAGARALYAELGYRPQIQRLCKALD